MLSRGRDARDEGMTLIELVVGMTLMTLVGALALSFFAGTTKQATRVTDQSLTGGAARTAMAQIVTSLQVTDAATASPGAAANRFAATPAPTEVTFYSDISPTGRSGTAVRTAPTKVDFTVTGGTLTESLWAPLSSTAPATNPASNYATAPTTKLVLATGITNTTSPAVFTYCSDATDPSKSCTATTDPTAVAMVQVTLVVAARASGSSPQTLQTGVAIGGQLS